MSIEGNIRSHLYNPKLETTKRETFKFLLGEFNRVNDGKPIDDKGAVKVLKRVVKDNEEVMKVCDHVAFTIRDEQNHLINELLPLENIATEEDMKDAITASIPLHVPKPHLRFMKPCLQYLEDKGLTVDKKRLSEILRVGL